MNMTLAIVAFAMVSLTSCSGIRLFRAEPPTVVREGKTPEQYYQLGVHYKAAGWPEQARECMERTIKGDENGAAGKRAKVYLAAYLPRDHVSPEAVRQNIIAFNLRARGKDEEAIAAFQECMIDYPTFEWPYGNLAGIYTKLGRHKEAQATLYQILNLNPNYLNGWVQLATALAADGDKAGAIRCAKRALQIDPTSSEAKELLNSLQQK